LFLLFRTVQSDKRSVYDQALQEVASSKVFRKRKCIFTHLRDAALTTVYRPTVPAALSGSTKFRWFFNYGALVCRYVYIDERYYHSKQSYKGEARVIYKRECHTFQKRGTGVGRSPSDPLDSENEASRVQNPVQHGPPRVQTFCDFFSGIGGVSEGARLAGFKVHVALEKDRTHMESYENNFPETQCLHMDAQDFSAYASRESHGGDHCHFSCPCKYWSMCQ
jgi:DNA (cytosine-5)-methyltransferase 1